MNALIVTDIQYDFCPGGNLAVPEGGSVIEPANRLLEPFSCRVFTQDWHPAGHLSFASSHHGEKPRVSPRAFSAFP